MADGITTLKFTVAGCGDAFGSGGRMQTAYHLAGAGDEVLIDCGATVLPAFQRFGLDPNRVSTIVISHLHGDHFGGLIWWYIYALYAGRRRQPLTIAGPRGIEARFVAATEALFPTVLQVPRPFDMRFAEYEEQTPLSLGKATVIPFEVEHFSGAPSYALRLSFCGKTVAFSGDTAWTESLIPASAGADLFILECSEYTRPVPGHLSWATLEGHLDRFTAARILLTHMGEDMLRHQADIKAPGVLLAEDGLVLRF